MADFPVVVGTDGSKTSWAALVAARIFPWPSGAEIHGVVARRITAIAGRPRYVIDAFDREFERIAADARALLSRRWPDVDVAIVDKAPAAAIVDEPRKLRAKAIVVGWRGHGPVRRLLLGSVSRAVVRKAPCSVLVVRRRPKKITRVVMGIDGSANARNAVDLVAHLPPPTRGIVTLVTALEPISLPSHALLPGQVRRQIGHELGVLKGEIATGARHALDRSRTILELAGWRVRVALQAGYPLEVLLDVGKNIDADLVVVGARGTSGLERVLLGSVADGIMNHSPVPVLIVR